MLCSAKPTYYFNNPASAFKRFGMLTFILGLVLLGALSFSSAMYAQTTNSAVVVPVISLLLSEEELQCPSVTDDTTVEGDRLITSQEDLNALLGVTRINGGLSFDDIALSSLDFSPLNSLVELGEDESLSFNNTNLTRISGFNCLQNVGSFHVMDNAALTELTRLKLSITALI